MSCCFLKIIYVWVDVLVDSAFSFLPLPLVAFVRLLVVAPLAFDDPANLESGSWTHSGDNTNTLGQYLDTWCK